MTAVAPGSAYRIGNRYYKSDEEFLYACAEVMREEYKVIVEAGLILQFDDPATATGWDMITPEPALADYKKFTIVRIDALNHALRGLPPERIRYHLCWGSWHGPHITDIPLRDIVDVMLAVNAGGFSFEAGNARHEHEWKVWRELKLPDDKLILPGVVSHATNVVEHLSLSPIVSSASPSSSGVSGSSPRPIADLAAGCTRRSPGPSWKPSELVPLLPQNGCGVEPPTTLSRLFYPLRAQSA